MENLLKLFFFNLNRMKIKNEMFSYFKGNNIMGEKTY